MIGRIPALLMILLIGLLSCACEMLYPVRFMIESWSPGIGYSGDGTDAVVSVTFSTEADRSVAENAFSLTEDGSEVRGSFSWDSLTMRFLPYAPLRPNREYRIFVDGKARGLDGHSLDVAADFKFNTRDSGSESANRTRVSAFEPQDGAVITQARQAIAVSFTGPVEAADCRDHIAVIPAIAGAWSLEGSPIGTVALFQPIVDWDFGVEYRVEVPADMVDAQRRRFGKDASVRFTRGADTDSPRLVCLEIIDADESIVAVLENAASFCGLERSHRIRLRFSEPVVLSSLDGLISSGPPIDFERETTGRCSASVVYRLPARLKWGESFEFRLEEGARDRENNVGKESGAYRLTFDGPSSRPPRFVGMRMPLAPGAVDKADRLLTTYSAEDAFTGLAVAPGSERYDIGVPTASMVELYFETATGAAIDPVSVMENFRVESTNGALSFSPRRVSLGNFLYAPHEPWSCYRRIQIEGVLTNNAEAGLVTFVLDDGFKDSKGNIVAAAIRLPLVK